MIADPVADLRGRLLAMRADLVTALLRNGYSAGIGALLAGLNAALDALGGARKPAGERDRRGG